MRFSLLGSGSAGNVAFVEAGETRVLIDAGLAKRELEHRLYRMPSAPRLEQIDAVLLTHEHSDHARAAARLGRPLFATAGTRRALGIEATRVQAGAAFVVGALSILPVLLPHDAAETVGYVVTEPGHGSVGLITDCGHPSDELAAAYAGCEALALEANHDVTLLRRGPYPASLKRRVAGPRGHLSNEQAAALLALICRRRRPQLVILAHLSKVNNRPILARQALARALAAHRDDAPELVVATDEGSPSFRLEKGRVQRELGRREQLSFRLEEHGLS